MSASRSRLATRLANDPPSVDTQPYRSIEGALAAALRTSEGSKCDTVLVWWNGLPRRHGALWIVSSDAPHGPDWTLVCTLQAAPGVT